MAGREGARTTKVIAPAPSVSLVLVLRGVALARPGAPGCTTQSGARAWILSPNGLSEPIDPGVQGGVHAPLSGEGVAACSGSWPIWSTIPVVSRAFPRIWPPVPTVVMPRYL
jgi:hypothetical protein